MPVSLKPTMQDVARIAGVGTMTVSRVLNQSPSVAPETADRVQRVIEKLGYRPNAMARALRGLKSRAIGVIVPSLYDPFFAACTHAIATVARHNAYSVLITTSDEDAAIEAEEAILMLEHHVEGIILVPASERSEILERPEFAKMNIVALDRPIPLSRTDHILTENESGAQRAIDHLISHRHQRILFVGTEKRLFTVLSRYQGYRHAMKAAGLSIDSKFGCTTPENTLSILRPMLMDQQRPTAIFTCNNLTTRFVLQTLENLSLKIPGDVALLGFDDFEFADALQPTISVVRQPVRDLGRRAAELLFEQIRRKTAARAGKRLVLPVELILRRSCGCEGENISPSAIR